jgi:ABC-type transport system substrate-binding protein
MLRLPSDCKGPAREDRVEDQPQPSRGHDLARRLHQPRLPDHDRLPAGHPRPDDFYYLTLHGGEPRNFTGYSNPAADQPLEAARFSNDPAERKALYAQALETILNDAPVVFTHYELVNYAFLPSVQGVSILPSMDLRFEDVWLDG